MYATGAEFTTYSGQAVPADIDRLLARASDLIDSQVTSMYSLETDGTFTETAVADVFRDATCAQVEWWLATGDEVEATARFKSPGVGGLDVTSSGLRLAPRAADALDRAGLRQVRAS